MRQVNETVMDWKEYWKEYRNACTDHEVPSEKDLSLGPHTPLGPHAPDSECSSPPRSAAAQTAQCTSATKAEPNTRKKEMQSADTDPSMDNLSLGQHAPLGPHAPESKSSSPPENAAAQAAQCTSATKAEPETRQKEIHSADKDPSMDNLSLGQHAPDSICSAKRCTSTTKAAPDTIGKKTRQEEMKRAAVLLTQEDLDGDRVMMLVQQVTAVSGTDRKENVTSAFFYKGSTCSMVTSSLVNRLGLPTEKKVLVVQSFLHTQTINTQFTVIELLRDDGNLEQIRAYVVDKITTLAQVVVPDEIRLET